MGHQPGRDMGGATTAPARGTTGGAGIDAEVKQFLDGLGRAVTMGDGRSAVRHWEVPALVIADADVRLVSTVAEIQEFFSRVKNHYFARGVMDTHPVVQSVEWITDRMVVVRVRWPFIDEAGDEIGEEISTYTLRRDDVGNLKLRVAVMHGEAPIH